MHMNIAQYIHILIVVYCTMSNIRNVEMCDDKRMKVDFTFKHKDKK